MVICCVLYWINLPEEVTNREINQPLAASTEKIVEARGWIVDEKGKVFLVAQSPQNTYSATSGVFCHQ